MAPVMSRVALATAAFFCFETSLIAKKKKRKRWTRSWLGRRGQLGMPILQAGLQKNDPSSFRQLLRMDVDQFNSLLQLVTPHIAKKDTHLRRAISPRERLSVTLRFLATGESFGALSFQYGFGRSTVGQIVKETCKILHQVLKGEYLKTPSTEDEWREVATGFQQRWQFPHCIGAMDGKHITIMPPNNSGNTFTVVLLSVVDAHYRFLYAEVGTQSCVSDGDVYVNSDLKRALDRNTLKFPRPDRLPDTNTVLPYAFLADEAFPLHSNLMKPYPFPLLDHDQRIYNYRLSRARRVVENAFGILANRWGVLLKTISLEPETVCSIILTALCLHNYLCTEGDTYLPGGLTDEDEQHNIISGNWRNQAATLQSVSSTKDQNPSKDAKEQREKLKQYFASRVGSLTWQEDRI